MREAHSIGRLFWLGVMEIKPPIKLIFWERPCFLPYIPAPRFGVFDPGESYFNDPCGPYACLNRLA